MSIVNGQSFPNTTFPDSIQSFQTFTNLTSTDESNYINYIRALVAGDYVAANGYLSAITGTAVINAEKLNQISDTVGAIQAVYTSSNTFTDIVTAKQAEWQSIINHFSYIGAWVAPTVYDNGTTYEVNSLVIYNNKTWKCITQTTGGNVPQVGSTYWTQHYYKNNIVEYFDADINRTLYYIASVDISSTLNPKADYASANPQWIQLSVVGIAGENGDGFSYEGEWDSTDTYSTGNLVSYNKKCYKSLQDNNINKVPSVATTWWEQQFEFNIDPILIQAETPVGQAVGGIWFKTVSLS